MSGTVYGGRGSVRARARVSVVFVFVPVTARRMLSMSSCVTFAKPICVPTATRLHRAGGLGGGGLDLSGPLPGVRHGCGPGICRHRSRHHGLL